MLPWHRNLCAHADLPQHCFDPSDGLPRVNTGNVTGIATSLDHLARHLTEWTDSAPHPLWRKVLLAHGSGNVTTLHVNGATESYQRAPQPRLSLDADLHQSLPADRPTLCPGWQTNA